MMVVSSHRSLSPTGSADHSDAQISDLVAELLRTSTASAEGIPAPATALSTLGFEPQPAIFRQGAPALTAADPASSLQPYLAALSAPSSGGGPATHLGLASCLGAVPTPPLHSLAELAFLAAQQPQPTYPMLSADAEMQDLLGLRREMPVGHFHLGDACPPQSAGAVARDPGPNYSAAQLHQPDLYGFGGVAAAARPPPNAMLAVHNARALPGSYYARAAILAQPHPDMPPQDVGHLYPGTAAFSPQPGPSHAALSQDAQLFRNQSLSSSGGRSLEFLPQSSDAHTENDGRESSLGSDGDVDSGAGSGRAGYWKNRPRNSISRVQKQIFYSWLLDHTANPFPSENERIGVLAHDSMTERQFKYWFANIRCRQFTKHRDLEGNLYFVPAAKFYESCIRLGLPINHEIPATVQRDMKLPRQPSRRQQ